MKQGGPWVPGRGGSQDIGSRVYIYSSWFHSQIQKNWMFLTWWDPVDPSEQSTEYNLWLRDLVFQDLSFSTSEFQEFKNCDLISWYSKNLQNKQVENGVFRTKWWHLGWTDFIPKFEMYLQPWICRQFFQGCVKKNKDLGKKIEERVSRCWIWVQSSKWRKKLPNIKKTLLEFVHPKAQVQFLQIVSYWQCM